MDAKEWAVSVSTTAVQHLACPLTLGVRERRRSADGLVDALVHAVQDQRDRDVTPVDRADQPGQADDLRDPVVTGDGPAPVESLAAFVLQPGPGEVQEPPQRAIRCGVLLRVPSSSDGLVYLFGEGAFPPPVGEVFGGEFAEARADELEG